MARQIEFFYDYLSPFSYLADTQLPAIAAADRSRDRLSARVSRLDNEGHRQRRAARDSGQRELQRRGISAMGQALRTARHVQSAFSVQHDQGAARGDRGANAWTVSRVPFGGVSRDLGTGAGPQQRGRAAADTRARRESSRRRSTATKSRIGCAPTATKRSAAARSGCRRFSSTAKCSGATIGWISSRKL